MKPGAVVLAVWLSTGPVALALSAWLVRADRRREKRNAAALDALVAAEAPDVIREAESLLDS